MKLRIRKETRSVLTCGYPRHIEADETQSKRKAQSQDWSSDKRSAVSSFGHPIPMGPPPNRRMTGEDITVDQVSFSSGLGIRGAVDRAQYNNTQSQLREGFVSSGDYRSLPNTNTTIPGLYLGQNIPAYDRSASVYNPTTYANTQFLIGQPAYSNDTIPYSRGPAPSSALLPFPVSSTQDQAYSAVPSTSFPFTTTTRYGGSYDTDNTSRSDPDRQYTASSALEMPPPHDGRIGQSFPGASYNQSRTGLLLTEPTGTMQSSWTSAQTSLSTQALE